MHPSLSTSYLLPAVFLNPVLFLHGLNTILSRIVPPIAVASSVQPPPYSTFGPSGMHPHLDIHASDNLCWSYAVVMICAQLMAFGRVHRLREEGREKRLKKDRVEARRMEPVGEEPRITNGHSNSRLRGKVSQNLPNGKIKSRADSEVSSDSDSGQENAGRSGRDTSEESEIIL
ncbi:MAG: hypothetical protein Q9183_001853 [Haloplaca sp. 2 TL-2023]